MLGSSKISGKDGPLYFVLYSGLFQDLLDKALGLHLSTLLRPLNEFCHAKQGEFSLPLPTKPLLML